MNISYKISKPIATLLVQTMVIITAAALWAPNAMATADNFALGCAGCHGNPAIATSLKTIVLDITDTETGCVSCHEHATKDIPPSIINPNPPLTLSAQPQQQVVKPGAAFKVDITGGNIGINAAGIPHPRNGSVRLRLYDAANTLLTDGHGSLGANKQPGITIDATAPATVGQVNWQAAWLGNTVLRETANLVTSSWPVEIAAKNTGHGEQRVDFSFYVCDDIDNDGFFSATCLAPGITLDCDDADATKATVCPVNIPPTANAGPDQTVAEGSTVKLDGNGSTDAENNPLTFNWTIATKPANSNATLLNATAAAPDFICDLPGTYSVQLVVNDGTVNSAVDTVAIVSNAKPIATAGNAQMVIEGVSVTLDGTGSSDPEGDALTYNWAITASPQGSTATLSGSTSANPSFIPDTAGLFTIELLVNDGLQNSAPASVAVTAEKANIKPVANVGANQTVNTGDLVVLNGSLSNDIDGPVSPLIYSWTVISIPTGSAAVLSNATAAMPTFTTDLVGSYVFELVVNDGLDNSIPSGVTVTAGAVTNIPVADAGLDQAVFVNALVMLDGSKSTDADGDGLTYSWSIMNFPPNSAVVLSDSTAVKPTFTPDLVGQYEIELTVNDGFTNSNPDIVIVTAGPANTKPVANAGDDQTVAEDNFAPLDGSGSSDANGDALAYDWTIMASPDGSTAVLEGSDTVMPTLINAVPGVYVVALVVNDGTDDSEADTVMVMFGAENTPPMADAGMNQGVIETDTVVLDGSGSTDANGDALTYSWSFTSSPINDPDPMLTNPTAATPTFLAKVTGTYIVQLIVNDNTVDSKPTTVTIMVGDGNTSPVANAGPDQAVFLDNTVTLDSSASTDADGDPLTYSWTMTSIPPQSVIPVLTDASAIKPTFVVTATGDYIAQLNVNDGKADSMLDTVVISVEVNVKPVADAGPDQAGTVGMEVSLDGSGSSDADEDNLTFGWTISSAPEGSNITALTNPTESIPSFVPDIAGEYIAQLIVNDGMTDSDPDAVIINVENGNTRPLADAGIDQTVTVNDTVTINGSQSSDADNDDLTYLWAIITQPDGSNLADIQVDLTAAQLVFQATVAGDYVFQLIVNDGTVDSMPNTVMVSAADVVAQAVEEPNAKTPPAQDPEPSANPANETAASTAAAMAGLLAMIMEMIMLVVNLITQLSLALSGSA